MPHKSSVGYSRYLCMPSVNLCMLSVNLCMPSVNLCMPSANLCMHRVPERHRTHTSPLYRTYPHITVQNSPLPWNLTRCIKGIKTTHAQKSRVYRALQHTNYINRIQISCKPHVLCIYFEVYIYIYLKYKFRR